MKILKNYIDVHEMIRGGDKLLEVKGIVVHTSDGITSREKLLKNINLLRKQDVKYLSYHYIIDENASVFQLVPIDEIAYHSQSNYINENYIGICIIENINKDIKNRQLISLKKILKYLFIKYNLSVNNVKREYDIYSTRKSSLLIDNVCLWNDILKLSYNIN